MTEAFMPEHIALRTVLHIPN